MEEMCIRAYLWDFQCSTQDTFCALSSISISKYENCYFKLTVSDIKPLPQQHHKEGYTELPPRLAYFQHLLNWVKDNLAVQTLAVVKALNTVWTNPPAAIATQAWDLVPVESP